MPTSTFAIQTPSFPSCTNPEGSLKVKYDSGIHGIVGDPKEYSGSDAVYQVTEDTLIQCFCPSNGGSGIQTNWLKTPQISQEEIDSLKSSGWVFIPTGSVWGLTNDPYMAQNVSYSCNGTGGGGEGETSGGTGGGTVLGAVGGQVLGLASTGNIQTVLNLFVLGVIFIIAALILKKRRSV